MGLLALYLPRSRLGLLELQRLDTTADQLNYRRARLPEREVAGAAQGEVSRAQQRRDAINRRLAELDAAIENLEREGLELVSLFDRRDFLPDSETE